MMNLMRADMYRIFRGKAVYITFGIMVLIVLLTVYVMRVGPTVGVTTEPLPEDTTIGELLAPVPEMSGSVAANIALGSMNVLIYMLLPLFIVVATAAFSSGAVKNELPMGISRMKYYFSKLVLSGLFTILAMLLFFVLHVLMAIPVDGVGYWGSGFVLDSLQIFGAQLFIMLAITAVGIFLCFATRRTGAVIGLYLAFLLAPSMIISIIAIGFENAMNLLNYELAHQILIFSTFPARESYEIIRGLLIGAAFLVVPTAVGLALFKRAEIQ